MIRKMKRALVVPSAVMIFGALALACGDEKEDPDGMPGGMEGGCEMGKTVQYQSTVVDATTPTTKIAGIKVEVLDDATGQPLNPPVSAMSGADGSITLPVASCVKFGVKAWAKAGSYTDTYSYHITPENSGKPDQLVRMSGEPTASVVPTVAGYTVKADRSAAAGAVYWKLPSDPVYGVVGCAQIETASGDVPDDWDLRFFKDAIPSSLTEWPLVRGTRAEDGRFFMGNIPPGKQTLVAKVNGEEIGRTDLFIFARTEASTMVGGTGANLFLAGIYIDAPAGSTNPTPAGCKEQQLQQ
jgi:hypothetical protein